MLPTQRKVEPPCATCAAPAQIDDGYCRRCGYAQPGATGTATSAQAGEPAVLLRTRPGSMRSIAATGLAVVLICAVAVAILFARAIFFGPGDLVRAYFDALADRDADRAWSMLADDAGSRHALLAAETLDNPGYHPPANLTVESLTRDQGRAVADVSFDVAGAPQRLALGLGPNRGGVLQRWEIDGGLFTLDVADGTDAGVVLAGAAVTPEQLGDLYAFPGGYELALPEDPLLELEPATAIAGGEPVTATPVVHDDGAREIERQVHAYLDECLESRDLYPEGCQLSPYEPSYFETYMDVSWSLVEYPELAYELQPDSSVWVYGSGGQARVTATAESGLSPDLDEVVELMVEGWAMVDGGQVWFEPDV